MDSGSMSFEDRMSNDENRDENPYEESLPVVQIPELGHANTIKPSSFY